MRSRPWRESPTNPHAKQRKRKSEATAGARSGGNGETAKSSASDTVDLLKGQHRELKATLAKRSDANADPSAIVKEFAAAWLPHTAVEQEILVPALNEAGVDEEKIAAIAIQKDIINLLLADLLRDESRQFGQAKLEALAKQFDALVEGAGGEDSGLFAIMSSAEKSIPGLNAQMKARYERLKTASRIWTKASERPWSCWRRGADPDGHSAAAQSKGSPRHARAAGTAIRKAKALAAAARLRRQAIAPRNAIAAYRNDEHASPRRGARDCDVLIA